VKKKTLTKEFIRTIVEESLKRTRADLNEAPPGDQPSAVGQAVDDTESVLSTTTSTSDGADVQVGSVKVDDELFATAKQVLDDLLAGKNVAGNRQQVERFKDRADESRVALLAAALSVYAGFDASELQQIPQIITQIARQMNKDT